LGAVIDARTLPGGSQARVRVLASDGFNTTIVVSEPFALNKHAPQALIGGVTEGQRIGYGEPATLSGMVVDAEDGSLASEALNWSIAGPSASIGNGNQLSLDNLTPGAYAATLTGTDSNGQTGSATRNFEVLPLSVPDGAAPTLDGYCADDGYANAPVVRITRPDGAQAQARLVHAGGKLFVCFTNLQTSANATPLAVGVRIDANASGGSQTENDDVGFKVDENGVPYQLVNSNGQLQVTLSPAAGFATSVQRNGNDWNAELSISENLVGGWNHAVRLWVNHASTNAVSAAELDAVNVWPPASNANQPGSWAPTYFGALPVQANRAPVAVTQPTILKDVGVTDTVGLNGSASYDADGDALTFAWTQVEGPMVAIQNANSATPNFTVTPAMNAATLRFQLVVNDGKVNSAPATTNVMLNQVGMPNSAETFPVGSDSNKTFLPIVTK
jgi:hypothetical protein